MILNMRQWILSLVLLASFLLGHSHAQGNGKCAANGEYCLLHSDCCSGSCLSFSYKCVPTPPSASVGVTRVPVTVDTANRFGGSGDGGASITQKTCAKNGEYCQLNQECCSRSCLSYSYKCVPVPPGQEGAAPASTASSSSVTPSTVDFTNRVGDNEGTSSSTVVTPATTQKCAGLGEYCLLSSECCSGACLNFSYKCVTNPKGDATGQHQAPAAIPPTPPSSASGTTAEESSGDIANRFDEAGQPSATTPKKCAAIGEYCLTAADCCSKSCLSFSYKCVHNYDLGQQVLTETGLPVNIAPVSNSNSIDTINRFGGGSDRQCSANGARCYRSGECCSGACYRSTCSTHVVVGVPESELTRPSAVNGPYVQVNSVDELITRFGGGSQAPQQAIDSDSSASSKRTSVFTNRNGTGRQCVVTGESCHRHEQCCSLKCLTYIRKCVT